MASTFKDVLLGPSRFSRRSCWGPPVAGHEPAPWPCLCPTLLEYPRAYWGFLCLGKPKLPVVELSVLVCVGPDLAPLPKRGVGFWGSVLPPLLSCFLGGNKARAPRALEERCLSPDGYPPSKDLETFLFLSLNSCLINSSVFGESNLCDSSL